MTRSSKSERTWSDAQLIAAVAASRSWRGVMRELGLRATSAGSIRVVRRHATRLSLDTSHFAGQRRWSEDTLRQAAPLARSWSELFAAVGVKSYSADDRIRLKAHARRLGLDLSHLEDQHRTAVCLQYSAPTLRNLRDAATTLAASWFSLCGFRTAIPIEPTVYDLLVSMPDGIKRVQVKTTTYKGKNGWLIQVGRRPYSIGNNARLVPYDPELVDLFFIVDGDLTMYLIPGQVIAGRVQILLRSYTDYMVGDAAGLMARPPKVA